MEKIVIDKDSPLNPGDIIEMEFICSGMVWITATQIAIIEWKLRERKDFAVLSHSLPANNRVIFTIEVRKPPDPKPPEVYQAGVTPATIAVIIAAAALGAVFALTLREVRLLIKTPGGKAIVGVTGIAAILGLLILLRK